jgi:anti-anti-sigma factor
MMADGRVTYSQQQGWHVLHYMGKVDYTLAPAIDRFVDGLFGDGSVRPFMFDLTEARMLDSTNLGLIARAADRVQSVGGPRSVIVCTSCDIEDVLGSMGFQDIFDIVPEHPQTARDEAHEEAVTGAQSSQGELLRTMLEAHRTLASLNEKDREQFKDVVSMLEAESRR